MRRRITVLVFMIILITASKAYAFSADGHSVLIAHRGFSQEVANSGKTEHLFRTTGTLIPFEPEQNY